MEDRKAGALKRRYMIALRAPTLLSVFDGDDVGVEGDCHDEEEEEEEKFLK